MVECYALPTAPNYTAQLYKLGSDNKVVSMGQINNTVFWEKYGQLESGMMGIRYMCQISTNSLSIKPGLNDQIEIESKKFKFINIAKRQNPGFVSFWECELKSI